MASALGLELRSLEARDADALGAAFERAAAERVDGLYLLDNPVPSSSAPRVSELARRHRLPMSSANRPMAAAGGLLAYGVDRLALYRRSAGYVDRILKGADPAQMPVELPDDIRARDQPRNGAGPRPDNPPFGPGPGDRDHPIAQLLRLAL